MVLLSLCHLFFPDLIYDRPKNPEHEEDRHDNRDQLCDREGPPDQVDIAELRQKVNTRLLAEIPALAQRIDQQSRQFLNQISQLTIRLKNTAES